MADQIYSLDQIHKLRYRVFCEEFGFEDPNSCPLGREMDHFDAYSMQASLSHVDYPEIIACIRLIFPVGADKLPFESFVEPVHAPVYGESYAEASRLAVAPEFRRRRLDTNKPSGMGPKQTLEDQWARGLAMPALAMIFAAASMGRYYKLDYVYVMIEPKLYLSMRSYGLNFAQVGPLVDYHGERACYKIVPNSLWESLDPQLMPLLDYIYEEFYQGAPPQAPCESKAG